MYHRKLSEKGRLSGHRSGEPSDVPIPCVNIACLPHPSSTSTYPRVVGDGKHTWSIG